MIWFDPYPPVLEAAKMADADDLAEIHASSFHKGWAAAEIESLLSDSRVRAVVAKRGSPFGSRRPVGFALIRAAGDEAEVLTIAVHPRQRGKGLGRKLMEDAMRRLYFDRIGAVFLEVDEGNVPALALYRRLGFQEVGRRKNYYATGVGTTSNALVMRADLT
ncbi:ribosomal protein S18-alanine N-acetyltransferase [Oryzibacter oryziterrae]|uniref:ribosomal protein S18-alanine N-acetyltransferase n=1 Tax=Oryzibacter oryziterrae TaxID=2766474 RepID=UPI001EFF7B0A|nr:ribosomal protein S18-alanine N-acetyltransferase [Oryzibacter oryziterrae]